MEHGWSGWSYEWGVPEANRRALASRARSFIVLVLSGKLPLHAADWPRRLRAAWHEAWRRAMRSLPKT